MLQQPHVFFDAHEIDLMYHPGVFPLKRQIIQKLYSLFDRIKHSLKDSPVHQMFPFPTGTDVVTGKISQGENYLGYPYVVLDFPKMYDQQNLFTFRLMFWFGHYFTCSLVAGGQISKLFLSNFIMKRKMLDRNEIFFSKYTDAWKHEVEPPYQTLIDVLTEKELQQHVLQHNYFKFTYKFLENNGGVITKTVTEKYELMLRALL